jgi:phosphomevalonate kinase
MTLKADGVVIEAFYQVHKISQVLGVSNYVSSLIAESHALQAIRAAMREMGTLANVPIEPEPQTRLLDACMSYAGVIAGGVPGG